MHLIYIPVVQKRNAKKQMTTRINCSEFWKGRDSYARLQDEFYSWMTNRGYDLERGKTGSVVGHLTTEEYKLKKVQEQLDHNFGAFYDSVADEVALKDENEKLRRDVLNIGNQYHGVCQELQQVTETNTQLNEIITEQKEKIHTLTENLTALQKLHKALEEKLDRVMQFIESLHLKEKLDTFLHRKHHAR